MDDKRGNQSRKRRVAEKQRGESLCKHKKFWEL